MSPPGIEGLRRRLSVVDGELQRAIARRLALARAIGAEKRRLGLPLRDLEVERAVVGRWQAALERDGVGAARAARLARWLVAEAVRAQRSIAAPTMPADGARSRRILVIGGVGAMGRWLVTRLMAQGHRVAVLDPNAEGVALPRGVAVATSLEAARNAEVVIIATPIPAAPGVYAELVRQRARATILDVLSVKAPIVRWIRAARAQGLSVGSLHPMFGPRSFDVSGRVVLVVDCGDRRANRLAAALLGDGGLRRYRVALEAHDRWMAELQTLPRVAGLAFAASLSGGRTAARRRARVGPPSFQRQLEITRTSIGEDSRLTWDLLATNPFALRAADRLAREVAAWRRGVAAGDRREFDRRLRRARAALGQSDPPPLAARRRSRDDATRPSGGPRARRRRAAGGARTRGASRPTSRGGSPA